jgi:hypothetical protein
MSVKRMIFSPLFLMGHVGYMHAWVLHLLWECGCHSQLITLTYITKVQGTIFNTHPYTGCKFKFNFDATQRVSVASYS